MCVRLRSKCFQAIGVAGPAFQQLTDAASSRPQYVTLPNAQPATTNAPPQPIPGLTDIASDASGRHVFAVGAPMFKNDYVYPGTVYFVTGGAAGAYVANSEPNSAGPGNPNLQSGAGVTSAVTSAAVGTIIVRSPLMRKADSLLLTMRRTVGESC